MKKRFWLFFGVVIATIIVIAILTAVLNICYVRELFSADIPEWLKWAFLLFS